MYLQMGQIESRHQFGQLLTDMGLNGNAVEIGTHRGEFAKRFLAGWDKGTLHCVDPYIGGYDDGDPASHGNRENDYSKAIKNLSGYHHRATFVRKTSIEASEQFHDGQLDFVYIDGKHRMPDVAADLRHWYPKVKPGGILAGHDIVSPREPNGGWGREVQPAVFAFAQKHNLPIYLVTDNSAYPWSYYMIKE